MSKTLMPTERMSVAKWQGHRLDDFDTYSDTQLWTKLAADAGASVALATTNMVLGYGVLTLTTGAVDNNEAEIYTTSNLFKFLQDQPLHLECRLLFNEANTSAANVGFGLVATTGANILLDNGGGPSLGTDGCLIYKLDGETTWRVYSVVNSGTAKSALTTKSSAPGSNKWQCLGIDISPISTTRCEISYTVDDLPLFDSSSSARPGMNLLKHVWDVTTTAQLAAVVYVKAGSSSSEVLQVDCAGWEFRRPAQ